MILVLLNCNHIALFKSVLSLSVEFLISESFKVKEGHLFKISPFQKWHFPWSYEVETGLIRKSASRKPSMQVFSLIQLSADFIEFFEIFSGFIPTEISQNSYVEILITFQGAYMAHQSTQNLILYRLVQVSLQSDLIWRR